jgi:hypothetical protein
VAAHAITQPVPGVDGVIRAAAEEDEAVGEPGRPVERLLAGSARPCRSRSWAGLMNGDELLTIGHLLMLPAMLLAMLHRRTEYAAAHTGQQ